MANTRVKQKVSIQIPSSIAKDFSDEALYLYQDKILTKVEYYKSRLSQMESKYHMTFQEFKKKVETSDKEIFSEWDDLMLWEGYYLGFQEWSKKNDDIQKCMK